MTDGTVRAPPHLLQLEFFYTSFVRGDSSALDTDVVLLDGLGRVDGDLIVSLRVGRRSISIGVADCEVASDQVRI